MSITPADGPADHAGAMPSSSSRSASKRTVSQSGQLPPSPTTTRKQMTVRAAALAKKPLVTTRTFVDGVVHQQTLALELLAKDSRINRGLRLVTQPIGALLAGRLFTIDGPTAPRRCTAHRAGSSVHGRTRRKVTRPVTHGV